MAGVNHEPESGPQPLDQVGELLGRHFGDGCAAVAHQVNVPVALGGVARRAVPEVGVLHQIETFEQLKGAVNGGDIDRGRDALDVLADALRGGMFQFPHRVEHQLTLRGQPHSPLVQRPAQAGVHPMMVPRVLVLEWVSSLVTAHPEAPRGPAVGSGVELSVAALLRRRIACRYTGKEVVQG